MYFHVLLILQSLLDLQGLSLRKIIGLYTKYDLYNVILTRASLEIPVGKVDFALSGAAELGVHVHGDEHPHILIRKESKYVPLFDFVLKCARATDFQTFCRP